MRITQLFLLLLALSYSHGIMIFVAQVNRSLTVLCPINAPTYSSRSWIYDQTTLRPVTDLFLQNSLGQITRHAAARQDMSVNVSDFSITIGRLEFNDNGRLQCVIDTGIQTVSEYVYIYLYDMLINVHKGTTITLPCPVANPHFDTRRWFIGTFPIFYQSHSQISRQSYGWDFSVNNETFDLAINRVVWSTRVYCIVSTMQQTRTASVYLTAPDVEISTEENKEIKLQPREVQSSNQKFYYQMWQRVNGDMRFVQYKDTGTVFNTLWPNTRNDISVNPITFELTIGKAQLKDDTTFIWRGGSTSASSTHVIRCNIYVNPKIHLTGLDEDSLIIDTTLTVACTIERVYPALSPHDFTMSIGSQVFHSTGFQNSDKSYRYRVEHTLRAVEDVNGTVVSCHVITKRGQQDTASKVIFLRERGLQDGIINGVSLPVIVGSVAAGVVLLLLLISIIVCVCLRRKTRVNDQMVSLPDTPSKEESGASHPNIANIDEIYLQPVDNYHEYEKIHKHGLPTDDGKYEKLRTGSKD